MLGFIKAKFGDLEAAAAKFRDKETAEAVVAIMCGTSYADGELEDAEKKKLIGAFKVNPVLKQYDTSMLLGKFNELAEQCDFDRDVGQDACLKELADVAGRGASEEKRLAILRMGVASAKADGEVEEAERAFLARAAQTLGLQLSQAGL